DGVMYKSGLEADVAKQLKHGKKKIQYEWCPLAYVLPERLYWPDFWINREGGDDVLVEVKGYLDGDSQRKMRAVKEAHPYLNIVFLFGVDKYGNPRNPPIRKGAKMRYSDWCEKYGFDYAFGNLKKEWL
ncbi:unnamed protein product, partial [marine sediment metagenome]